MELKSHPFAPPDEAVRERGGRVHSIRVIQGYRVRYWLDLLVAEIVVLEIERA